MMIRTSFFKSALILLLILNITPFLVNAKEFRGPISGALGGTGRASLDPIESAFLNPATLTHQKGYHMGVFYGDSSDLSSGEVRDLGIAIADSTPDKILPGALSYTRSRTTASGQNPIDQESVQLAVSDQVISQLTIGLGFQWLKSKVNDVSHDQFNMDLGLLYTPADNMGVGLVAYDLFGPSSEVPSEVQLKRSIGLGFTYVYQQFLQARVDWLMQMKDNPNSDSKLMVGIDSALNKFFAIRVGAQWDDLAKQTFLTTGLGFNGPRLSMDYAAQFEVQGDASGLVHLANLRLVF